MPVVAPDLPKLAWKLVDGAKEFHLYCKHTPREFLPDMWFDVWGFNDSMPGPTIEAAEGDRVRIIVHGFEPMGLHPTAHLPYCGALSPRNADHGFIRLRALLPRHRHAYCCRDLVVHRVFRENAVLGVICLFIPLGLMVALVRWWPRTWRPLGAWLLGYVLFFCGMAMLSPGK